MAMMDEEARVRQAARERLARLERARENLPKFMRKQGYSEAEIQRELEQVDRMAEVNEDVASR